MPADLLNFPYLVAEQHMGQFVGDVALRARRLIAWVVDSDSATTRQMKGGGGKGPGLQQLQLLQAVKNWPGTTWRRPSETSD